MEKDIGKIKKNDQTDVVIRIDDFGGKPGVTIREFVTSDRYTGFTKSGTRISADSFLEFREMVNNIDLSELTSGVENEPSEKVPKEANEPLEKVPKDETKDEEATEEVIDY